MGLRALMNVPGSTRSRIRSPPGTVCEFALSGSGALEHRAASALVFESLISSHVGFVQPLPSLCHVCGL